ncbi:AmmeMemoRadiSam system protein A [Dethiobacter alkaliphilus]|uniref:AmmeMemoRadiSam system protein A n=1 Tax=Dethiobacter alkaliphilus TaxID=427926 RepID=UPI0022271826|nr:AmmeMemoRadiSam system protein A [Dethiobacter alkaliphilus]MCW3490625.1 AmmeMemoRadiSam system protein A [Dethiobacter alkaliphilus]
MGKVVHAGIYPHPPIIVPEVGGKEAERVSATVGAMEEMARRVKESGADTLVVISPHGPVFRDAVAMLAESTLSGSLARFGAPNVELKYHNDKHLLEAIEVEADRAGIRTAKITERKATAYGVQAVLDHGAMVPLYFLHKAGVRMPMVHITFGMLPAKQLFAFGQIIGKVLQRINRRAAVVISGDLSHRLTEDAPGGYSPEGQEFDRKLVDLLSDYDVPAVLSINHSLLESAGECGYRSILIGLGILDGKAVQPEILSYEGTFGVGYLVADLTPGVARKKEQTTPGESEHVRLARQTLETFVREKEIIPPPQDTHLRKEKAGAFVTLKIDGQLRGCIGTIEPVQKNLAEEIIENTISAGFYDPRFKPVTEEELPHLEYSVDVLSEPEEVSGSVDLDPKKYGVIVQSGGRKGLLLPDLEGVETVEHQLNIALQKAGISPGEKYSIYRFHVKRHSQGV